MSNATIIQSICPISAQFYLNSVCRVCILLLNALFRQTCIPPPIRKSNNFPEISNI